MKAVDHYTFFIVKSVKEADGHSVVYHVKDLYEQLSEHKRKRLYKDCLGMLTRFYGKEMDDFDIVKEEFLL